MRRLIVCLALLLPMQAAFAQDVVQILADRLQRDGQGIGIVAAVIENNTPVFTNFGVTQAGGKLRSIKQRCSRSARSASSSSICSLRKWCSTAL